MKQSPDRPFFCKPVVDLRRLSRRQDMRFDPPILQKVKGLPETRRHSAIPRESTTALAPWSSNSCGAPSRFADTGRAISSQELGKPYELRFCRSLKTAPRDPTVSFVIRKGRRFQSITGGVDTKTPAGRFFFHVMASLAQMERELILERTRAGLEAARCLGRVGVGSAG